MKNPQRLALVVCTLVPMVGLALGLGGQPEKGPPPAAGGQPGMGPEMVTKLAQGLRKTPGCLGVEMGQFMSGKMVIFAWFEDKKALMGWYNDPAHQGAMDAMFPERDRNKVPMKDVPETGPIMAVASMTRGGEGGGMKLGIELYSALPGGARMSGGGFAPAAFVDRAEDDAPAAAAPAAAPGK